MEKGATELLKDHGVSKNYKNHSDSELPSLEGLLKRTRVYIAQNWIERHYERVVSRNSGDNARAYLQKRGGL